MVLLYHTAAYFTILFRALDKKEFAKNAQGSLKFGFAQYCFGIVCLSVFLFIQRRTRCKTICLLCVGWCNVATIITIYMDACSKKLQ